MKRYMIRTLWTLCFALMVTFLILSVKLQQHPGRIVDDRRLIAPLLHRQKETGPVGRRPTMPSARPSVDRGGSTGGEGGESVARKITQTTGGSTKSSTGSSDRAVLHTCSCLAGRRGSDDRDAPPQGRFRWLHIPKTGTSFIATLYSQACSERLGRIDLDISPHYRGGCGGCFDFALIARYPPELHCRRDSFDSFETQHRALSNVEARRARSHPSNDRSVEPLRRGTNNKTVTEQRIDLVGFFRDPKSRIVSAFDNLMHAVGMPGDDWKAMKVECKGNVTCYATRPNIMGCMAKMLIGKDCASAMKKTSNEILRTSLAALESMSFVGLTEEWNESICQFHKLFGGLPSQEQFKNVRPGNKRSKVDDLPASYHDEDDEAVFAAASEKFRRMVGDTPCYEAVEVLPSKEKNEACAPKSCADLGMQCGEWPDGCGGIVTCGLCGTTARDSLPDDWRHRCVEGACVRTCPAWVDQGIWFRGDGRTHSEWLFKLGQKGAPLDVPGTGPRPQNKRVLSALDLFEFFSDQATHLAPSDAIRLCADACASNHAPHKHFASKFCLCGSYPHNYLQDPPLLQEYNTAHDLFPYKTSGSGAMALLNNIERSKVYKLQIGPDLSQPLCCAAAPVTPPSKGLLVTSSLWRKGFVWADFFDSIDLECGLYNECEEAGVQRKATVVVLDVANRICHLGNDAGSVMSLPVTRHYLRLKPPERGIKDGPPLRRT